VAIISGLMAKSALGRGLGALLDGASPAAKPAAPAPAQVAAAAPPPEGREQVSRLALTHIRPCPLQPRKDFPEPALRELADSIREKGVVQPLIVRAKAGHYELIAGERRWRAAQLAGIEEVPVIVREADDSTVLELALVENLQRENLNPMEEAQGYQQLIQLFDLRQEDVAARVGKSRVVVANALRLLKLAEDLQAYVRNGQLSVGHAKVILGLSSPAEQRLVGERVIREGLNVRQTEELVAQLQRQPSARIGPAGAKTRKAAVRDSHVSAIEGRLQERLGTRVNVRYRQGKGAIEIRFFNDEDLERILQVVGVTPD
jgi:ParB family chromosome partitioning protein